MSRIVLCLAFCCFFHRMATAEDSPADALRMYVIGITVKDVVPVAGGGERTKVIASPKVATAENRKAVFQVGGQIKVADESVHDGLLLEVTVKKLGADKVQVSGVLEISNIAAPTDNFVERIATAYHFTRDISVGRKVRLGERHMSKGSRTIELTCDIVDALTPILPSQTVGGAHRLEGIAPGESPSSDKPAGK